MAAATGAAAAGAAAAGAAAAGRRAVVWFRNDLRLRDNAALHSIAEKVKAGEVADVVPVYIFDPRTFAKSQYGAAPSKTGARRAQFVLESVAALKGSLRAAGSDLLVAVGRPEDIIPGVRLFAGNGGGGGCSGGGVGSSVLCMLCLSLRSCSAVPVLRAARSRSPRQTAAPKPLPSSLAQACSARPAPARPSAPRRRCRRPRAGPWSSRRRR